MVDIHQPPGDCPPRSQFDTNEAHEVACIDFYWRSLAHRALHSKDPSEAKRMFEAVFTELDAGKTLHPAAVAWLRYVLQGPLKRARTSRFSRARYDQQEETLAVWWLGCADPALSIEENLMRAAEALPEASFSTWRDVYYRQTFAITLARIQFNPNK